MMTYNPSWVSCLGNNSVTVDWTTCAVRKSRIPVLVALLGAAAVPQT